MGFLKQLFKIIKSKNTGYLFTFVQSYMNAIYLFYYMFRSVFKNMLKYMNVIIVWHFLYILVIFQQF